MRFLRRLGLLALLLCCASTARAGIESKIFSSTDTGISGLACNANRTMTLTVAGFSQITIYVQLTRSAATAVNVACIAGMTLAQAAPLAVATVAGTGAISLVDSSFSYATAVSGWKRIQIQPLNDQVLSCVFSCTAANGSDLISVYARAGVP